MSSSKSTVHKGTLLLQFNQTKSKTTSRCKVLSPDSPLCYYLRDLRQRIILFVNPGGESQLCQRMDIQVELTQDHNNLDSVTSRIQGVGVDVSTIENYEFLWNHSFVLLLPSLQGRAEVAQPHVTILFKRGLLEHFAGEVDYDDQKRMALATIRHIDEL